MKKKFDIYNLILSSFDFRILYELNITKRNPSEPLLNLLNDIKEVKNNLSKNPQDILYFLYFNIDNIERILYYIDKIIYFDFEDKGNNFFFKINHEKIEIEKKDEIVFLFYISVLIKYNNNIVNFEYSIDLIRKINSINKNIDKNIIYKKILISKIILELINFYKRHQIYKIEINKEEKENLDKIEIENNNIIEKYINSFEKIGLKTEQKDLKLKTIDLINDEIINILLNSKDFNLIHKIIGQLDLENINITKIMFNEIFKTLSSNDNFLNEYRFTTSDDLFNNKKIDLYYFLFKYILKKSIYNSRKTNNSFKDKMFYIIKFFTNSEYYVNYIKNRLNINKLNDDKETNKSSSSPFEKSTYLNGKENSHREGSMINYSNNETIRNIDEDDNYKNNNKEEINQNPIDMITSSDRVQELQENISNLNQNEQNILSNLDDKEKVLFEDIIDVVIYILKDSSITLSINNDKKNKIEYREIIDEERRYSIIYEKFKIPFSEEQEKKFDLDYYNKLFENYKKLIEFLEKIKEIANTCLSKYNKLSIKIKLKEDVTKIYDDNFIKNINSEYIFNNLVLIDRQYHDKNILINNSYEGFESFLNDIVEFYKKNPQNKGFDKNLFANISSIPIKSNNIHTSSYNNAKEISSIIKDNDYHFISFIKIIGKHTKIAEKIEELDNAFISGGNNEIIIYDIDYKKKDGKHIYENYYTFFIDNKDVIISQKNKITYLGRINTNNENLNINCNCRNLLKTKGNKYILCDENGLYYYTNGLNDKNSRYELNKKSYRGGIKITDEIIAITSNSFLTKGEDKLIFFNSTSKSFINEFEVKNYSFTISENNCALIRIPNKNNCKLLLCACKKYRKGNKNGILLLEIQLYKNDIKTHQNFYKTENFEVYCFCPILDIENKSVFGKIDKTKANETGYFLVGGFDLDKNEGLIKLYEVIYDNEIENIEIKYIQDIKVRKKIRKEDSECFKGLKGPISCIIQSSRGGEILITCYDGNVYLFSKPDIKSLNYDNYNILK